MLYNIGAICYGLRWPNPWPQTFGHHEFFHAFTAAAAYATTSRPGAHRLDEAVRSVEEVVEGSLFEFDPSLHLFADAFHLFRAEVVGALGGGDAADVHRATDAG